MEIMVAEVVVVVGVVEAVAGVVEGWWWRQHFLLRSTRQVTTQDIIQSFQTRPSEQ